MKYFRNRGRFRRPAVDDYVRRMKSSDHVIYDDLVAKIIEQAGFEPKGEPRSIFDVEQLFLSLERYGEPRAFIVDEHLKRGFKLALKAFSPRRDVVKLHPLQLKDTPDAVKLTKSSGLPLLKSKFEALPYAMDRARQVLLGLKAPNPCIAFARTQTSKTRLVWGYPFEMTLIEAKFARPLIDRFLHLGNTPMAFGLKKAVLGGKIKGLENRGKYVYGLDYSKFDSSVHAVLIRMAFDILKTWFIMDAEDQKAWDIIVEYFISTPIVMPDGNLYTGKYRGVPSGSYFTQMIDSVVNVILLGAAASTLGVDLFHRNILVLGDDSIFVVNERIPLSEWAKALSKYGIVVSILKSVEEQLWFLGASWERAVPDLPLEQLISKAVYPERFRKYDDRKRGPFSVILSYASTYVSAIKLVPGNDLSGLQAVTSNSYLTGFDKFRAEYGFDFIGRKKVPIVTQRILL